MSDSPLHIVHTEASLGWGGQEIRILTEAAGLMSRGHRVTVIASPQSGILAQAHRYGVAAVMLPIGRKKVMGLYSLFRWLQNNRVDVINSHSSTDSWLAALACRLLPTPPPLVRTRHVSVKVADNLATRWLYRRATAHVVTTGKALREQLIRENSLPASHVSSIPTGIDPVRFVSSDQATARRELGLPIDTPLVGIVATLRSWKGHRYLLEALTQLRHDQARVVIVGDGPQRDALIEQGRALHIEHRLHFAGNQTDVAPWLNALDVFALPSYANEGIPQALLQAMFCQLACVTTDAGAIGEIATPEVTALVIPKQDSTALALALDRLLDDGSLRAELGRSARLRVQHEFTLDVMLDRMEALFFDVVRP